MVQNIQEVTIAVISFNGLKVIRLCLESIFSQSYRHFKVVLVDNASTDGTPDWVRNHYPEVEILNYPKNKGPNPARNYAIKKSSRNLVLLVDDDAVLEKNCLGALIEAYHVYPDAAVWSPRIVYYDRKKVIQFEGVFMHYLCEAIILNPERPLSDGVKDLTPIDIAGGVSYLVSKQAAEYIGFFDEDYFFGRTDGEFTFRLSLAGFKLYTVPNAICYHRIKKRGLSKVSLQMGNRLHLMLTTYSFRTLVLIFPALLAYELALMLFLLTKGKILDYFMAIATTLVNLPKIVQKRKSIQSIKSVSDKTVLRCAKINIRGDLINNRLVTIAKTNIDKLFGLYWSVIHRFI